MCPSDVFGNLPRFAIGPGLHPQYGAPFSAGLRWQPNLQGPAGRLGSATAASPNYITLYGLCPPAGGTGLDLCGPDGRLDFTKPDAFNVIIHEIGHLMRLGHDQTDGMCHDRSGIMRDPMVPNAQMDEGYCEMANSLNCDPNDPRAAPCPPPPQRPEDQPLAGLEPCNGSGFCPDDVDDISTAPTGGGGGRLRLLGDPLTNISYFWSFDYPGACQNCSPQLVEITWTALQWFCDGGICGPAQTTTGPWLGVYSPLAIAPASRTLKVQVARLAAGGTSSVVTWLDGQGVSLANSNQRARLDNACGAGVGSDPMCPYVGFAGELDTSGLSDGPHELAFAVTDLASPPRLTVVRQAFTVDNSCPDWQPPSGALISPTPSATVGGVVPIQATASDNVGVGFVDFFVDGLFVGRDAQAPWQVDWDTSAETNGSHRLDALVFDGCRNETRTSSIDVTKVDPDAEPPTVEFVRPVGGAVRGSVTVELTASDDTGVARVELRHGSTLFATLTNAPYVTTWNSAAASDGAQTLTATAYDVSGRSATSTRAVVVDNTGPSVAIASPVDGATIAGVNTTSVSASDPSGVQRVDLLVNGAAAASDWTSPYTFTGDTRYWPDGEYLLAAQAVDALGNARTSSTIRMYIRNKPTIRVVQDWSGAPMAKGSTYVFDPQAANVTQSARFRIYNDGAATLTITNPTTIVSGSCYSLLETPAATPIAAGGVTYFRVRELGSTPGTCSGAISIQSNDPDDNPFGINLQGTITTSAEIRVAQDWNGQTVAKGSTVVFDPQPVGSSQSKRYQIRNDGQASLTISNPNSIVSGACFSLLETPAATVAPGGYTYFRVREIGSAPGTCTGSVSIQSNDISDNPFGLALQGAITGAEIRVVQDWSGSTVAKGSTYVFDPQPVGVTQSARFRIHNDGPVNLTISNPSTILSGACFSLLETPAATVAPGGYTYFRVREIGSAPGTCTGSVSIQSNDISDNPFGLALQGAITGAEIRVVQDWSGSTVAKGSTYVFDPQPVGVTQSARFRIHNDGPVNLTISNPSTILSGACFSLLETPNATVAPGGFTYFRVRELGSAPGTCTGAVSIQSSDVTDNPFGLALQGTITGTAEIRVAQDWNGLTVATGSAVTFPTIAVGATTSKRYRIYNDGNWTLSISNASSIVSGGGFSLIETPTASIAPGGVTYFRVRFMAGSPGTYSGLVSIQSNDGNDNPFTLNLSGTAN